MTQSCLSCGTPNPAGSIFCIRCGNPIAPTGNFPGSSPSQAPNIGANSANSGEYSSLLPGYQPSNPQQPNYQPSNLQQPGYQPFNPQQPNYQSSGPQQPVYQASGAQMQVSSAPVQMGSTTTVMSDALARHAFAGHGTLITHHSWLLNGEQRYSTALRSTILDILRLRRIQALNLDMAKLQERGSWIEEREYLVMKRGIVTVFIYVAPAGQDLYISRATTVQLSFEVVRICILVFALAEVFFGPSILQSVLGSMMTSSLTAGPAAITGLIVPFIIVAVVFAILYLPSILFLISFLLSSFKHWLVEKDFWIYLRRSTLNDFEIDDIMLLEHATDETVQAAVKQLNLDASSIVPPAMGYQTKRRVRMI